MATMDYNEVDIPVDVWTKLISPLKIRLKLVRWVCICVVVLTRYFDSFEQKLIRIEMFTCYDFQIYVYRFQLKKKNGKYLVWIKKKKYTLLWPHHHVCSTFRFSSFSVFSRLFMFILLFVVAFSWTLFETFARRKCLSIAYRTGGFPATGD